MYSNTIDTIRPPWAPRWGRPSRPPSRARSRIHTIPSKCVYMYIYIYIYI